MTDNAFLLPADTTMGVVSLAVRDLAAQTAFYRDVIGLELLEGATDFSTLGVEGKTLLRIMSRPQGRTVRAAPGLYHLALLLPSRRALGQWLRHLAESKYPLSGASDHFVSEALYLSDPEGNGIEIYRDRPRSEWQRTARGLNIGTARLDLTSVLQDAAADAFEGLPPGTTMGHVHLQVSAIPEALSFYTQTLGFEDQMPGIDSAAFISAGGYHHHLGMNIWHSQNAKPRPADALGLVDYEIVLPTANDRDALANRVAALGHEVSSGENGVRLRDPSGNWIVLQSREQNAH